MDPCIADIVHSELEKVGNSRYFITGPDYVYIVFVES
jgi:hypothetical protein